MTRIFGPPSNQVSCTPTSEVPATYIFVVERGGNSVIRLDAADGANQQPVADLSAGSADLRDIDVDRPNQKIYVADFGNGKIVQMDLDGSNQTDWKTGLNQPATVRVHGGRVIWGEWGGKIVKSDLIEKGDEIALSSRSLQPTTVAADDDWVYTFYFSTAQLFRMSHDGAVEEEVRDFWPSAAWGSIIDVRNQLVYWSSNISGESPEEARRSGFDSGVETAYSLNHLSRGAIIDYAGDAIYACDFHTSDGRVVKFALANLPGASYDTDAEWEVLIDNAFGCSFY